MLPARTAGHCNGKLTNTPSSPPGPKTRNNPQPLHHHHRYAPPPFPSLQYSSNLTSPAFSDVREPHELQSTGRIPGAINIPVTSAPDSFHISEEEFEDRFGFPRPARDAEVVMYCRAGVRSRAAAGLATDAGWTRVGEYPGSWLDWAEKGGKVES